MQLHQHHRDRVEGSFEQFVTRNVWGKKRSYKDKSFAKNNVYESACNSRKSLGDDFLRASVVAVAVAHMTAKVFKYWRGRRDLFPRLSQSLPLPSSRKRDLLKVAIILMASLVPSQKPSALFCRRGPADEEQVFKLSVQHTVISSKLCRLTCD